jgi:hypothetical protein
MLKTSIILQLLKRDNVFHKIIDIFFLNSVKLISIFFFNIKNTYFLLYLYFHFYLIKIIKNYLQKY